MANRPPDDPTQLMDGNSLSTSGNPRYDEWRYPECNACPAYGALPEISAPIRWSAELVGSVG